jgi:bacteriocin-like protein
MLRALETQERDMTEPSKTDTPDKKPEEELTDSELDQVIGGATNGFMQIDEGPKEPPSH